jgi:protein required for attachment to host cells
MLWIVTANSSQCSIYRCAHRGSSLTLLKEFTHPEMRLKKSEYLTSDKTGHYKTDISARGAYEPHTDPKEVEMTHFCHEIANELDRGRNDHEYKELIIIAPPHMNGLLFQTLNKHVKELIGNKIQKDIQNFTQPELVNFLKTHAQYPDS